MAENEQAKPAQSEKPGTPTEQQHAAQAAPQQQPPAPEGGQLK